MKHFCLIILVMLHFLNDRSYAQKDTTVTDLDFDIGITRDQDMNIWPVIRYTKSKEEKDLQLMFTIFRSKHEMQYRHKHNHFLPFYWSDSSISRRDLRIGTLFYPSIIAYSKDYDKTLSSFRLAEIAPRINLMEITNSPDGMYMENNFFFFVWYKNNKIERKSYFIVFPLYWGFKNDHRSTKTLFPLYSMRSNHGNKDSYLAVTPLYWRFRTTAFNSDVVFPLIWMKKEFKHNDTLVKKTVFPIYYSRKNNFSDHKVLFPFIWSQKSWYRSFTFFPFFSKGHSITGNNKHLIVSPLYWHFRDKDDHMNVFFPLLWTRKEGFGAKEKRMNIVFPLYWSFQKFNSGKKIIFPVVWQKKTDYYSSFTLFPLISKGKSDDNGKRHLVITPLYWRIITYNSRSDMLFPFWYYKSKGFTEDRRVFNYIFPLYFDYSYHEKSRQLFFPLIWNLSSPRYESLTIMPFFSKGNSGDMERRHFAVTPLYWHIHNKNSRFDFIFPLWWYKKKGSGLTAKNTHVIFPVYFSYKSRYKNNTVVFPFTWKFRNSHYKSFTLFPVYSKGISSDSTKKHYAVTTFFWHIENDDKRKNILFPLWWHTRKGFDEYEKVGNVIFPVFWDFRKFEERNTVLFPVFWYFSNPYKKSVTLFPLFSTGHTDDFKRRHLVLTPLLWKIKNYDEQAVVLFPLLWSFKKKDHVSTVLFPVLWHKKEPGSFSLTVIPFFSNKNTSDNKLNHLIVTPFFWKIKDYNESYTVIFPLWWKTKTESIGGTKNSAVFFPLYWSVKDASINKKVFFPLVWKFKNDTYSSFTFFPLYSSGKTEDKLNKHLVVTPLFWKYKRDNIDKTLLFPFFDYTAEGTEHKRFSIFYFLYRYNRYYSKRSSAFIWPVCEFTADTNYRYIRFTPVLWFKKSPELSYFTIQPFYYHRLTNKSENHRIFWELYNYEHIFDVKNSSNFLWKLFFSDRYNNGDFETRLLYLIYANVNKSGTREKSIFPFYYHHHNTKGNSTTSWCFYFFNSIKRQIADTDEYYIEKRICWLIRVKSNYRSLLNKGIDKNLIKSR